MTRLLDATRHVTPTLTEDDLPIDSTFDHLSGMLRPLYQSPVGIPWFGATHDGYPSCRTLSSYTQVCLDRRTHHTKRDDAAL